MTHLPDEILGLVCTELWRHQDYPTLFNFACAGKQLASTAVTYLYRVQGVTPPDMERYERHLAHFGLDRSSRGYATALSNEQLLMKCARLWRTLILASQGLTLYPYSRYIRTLNLGDLQHMLDHKDFSPKIAKEFFHPITRFQQDPSPNFDQSAAMKHDSFCKSSILATVNSIGEAITKQTPLLEQLFGSVPSGSLSQWIPRLPRLTHLELGHFEAMEDFGTFIRLHCPSFKRLHIPWSHCHKRVSESEQTYQFLLASLRNLRPESLQSFRSWGIYQPSTELLQALSRHRESLTELEVGIFPSGGAVLEFPLLKGFTNLVSLSLTGGGFNDDDDDDADDNYGSEFAYNTAGREAITWLKQCQKLRNHSVDEDIYPDWTASFLLETSIQLTSLTFEAGSLKHPKYLYKAIASQTSLQCLWMMGIVLHAHALDADVLAESLSKLCDLTDLNLEGLSGCFVDRHVVKLASSLPKLERWSTYGYRVTDAIWDEVASLRSLRVLDITALTDFTAEGILGFIEKLRPSNRSFALFVNSEPNPDIEFNLSWAEQDLIQRTIAKKIHGRFRNTDV